MAADLGEAPSPEVVQVDHCDRHYYDVNGDGYVTPVDGLRVINELNRQGGLSEYDPFAHTDSWLDVNFDGYVTPIDALAVIAKLSEHGGPHPFAFACSESQQGNFYLTKGGDVQPQLVLGGERAQSVMQLQAHTDEPAVLRYIGFTADGTGADSIESLELFSENATSPFAVLTRAGAKDGDLFGGSSLAIFDSESVNISVRPYVKPDTLDGESGTKFRLSVSTIEAAGVDSSNPLKTDAGELASVEHTIVMAKISSVGNANSDADGMVVPTGTSQQIGAWKLLAASHRNSENGLNDVVLDTLSFEVTSHDLQVNEFGLYNKADSSLISDRYEIAETGPGTYLVTFTDLTTSFVKVGINQGRSETFVLTATVVDTSENSSLKVGLLADEVVWFDQDGLTAVGHRGLHAGQSIVSSTAYKNWP